VKHRDRGRRKERARGTRWGTTLTLMFVLFKSSLVFPCVCECRVGGRESEASRAVCSRLSKDVFLQHGQLDTTQGQQDDNARFLGELVNKPARRVTPYRDRDGDCATGSEGTPRRKDSRLPLLHVEYLCNWFYSKPLKVSGHLDENLTLSRVNLVSIAGGCTDHPSHGRRCEAAQEGKPKLTPWR
jgi:hypothetical protein